MVQNTEESSNHQEKKVIDIKKHKWTLFIVTAGIGFALDWFTKHLAVTTLTYAQEVPVIGTVLQWQLIYNKGGLFGFNPQSLFSWFPTNAVYYVLSIIAMILIIVYYKNIESRATLSRYAISLIMAGAMGNLFDRVIRPGKGVVDFIRADLGFRPFNPWPIFNLADAYITVGVCMIILELWLQERKKKAPIRQSR